MYSFVLHNEKNFVSDLHLQTVMYPLSTPLLLNAKYQIPNEMAQQNARGSTRNFRKKHILRFYSVAKFSGKPVAKQWQTKFATTNCR